MKPSGGTNEDFGTRELLSTLADAYDKIDVAHGNFRCPLPSIHIIFFLVMHTCQVHPYAFHSVVHSSYGNMA
jgi:hypothetical protein